MKIRANRLHGTGNERKVFCFTHLYLALYIFFHLYSWRLETRWHKKYKVLCTTLFHTTRELEEKDDSFSSRRYNRYTRTKGCQFFSSSYKQ